MFITTALIHRLCSFMSVRYAKEPTEKLGFKRIETRDFDELLVAAFERAEKAFPLAHRAQFR